MITWTLIIMFMGSVANYPTKAVCDSAGAQATTLPYICVMTYPSHADHR
jgi:hypothetical protein